MSGGFTPGPWRLGWQNTICSGTSDWNEIPLATGWVEGAWQDEDATEESIANARLIAAAPELYEALSDLVSFLRAHIPHFQTYNPLTEDADNALAKARGEQVSEPSA